MHGIRNSRLCHKEFNRHLWTRLWPSYYKRDVDQGHHGMTMQHNQSYTAQPERKFKWLCNRRRKCVTDGGGLWKNKTASPSLPLGLLQKAALWPMALWLCGLRFFIASSYNTTSLQSSRLHWVHASS